MTGADWVDLGIIFAVSAVVAAVIVPIIDKRWGYIIQKWVERKK